MNQKEKSEKTKNEIINTATVLFAKKGYENTTIEDILTTWGGSKGSLYYYFKSKEEILYEVIDRHFSKKEKIVNEIIGKITASCAREKLTSLLEELVINKKIHLIDNIIRSQMKNPLFIMKTLNRTVYKDASYIAKIIMDGKKDGSITTDYPIESAETLLLLINIWTDPFIIEHNRSEIISRLEYARIIMKNSGIDVISDLFIQRVINFYSVNGGFSEG